MNFSFEHRRQTIMSRLTKADGAPGDNTPFIKKKHPADRGSPLPETSNPEWAAANIFSQ